jgi:phosphatidylethanolamine-binding protein (PEBP) family uncharacterized protein
VALLALLATIALSGCANEATTTTNSLAPSPPAGLKVTSSAIHGKQLPALYTCDGKDISPPISWGAVPASVEELALFILAPGRAKNGAATLSIEWVMAGIKPSLHSLPAGKVPRGAFLLAGSKGHTRYSICPPHGATRSYSFTLLALPRGARAGPGLPGPVLLRYLNEPTAQDQAAAIGYLPVSYTRR